MNIVKPAVFVASTILSLGAASADSVTDMECEAVSTENISLYFMSNMKRGDDVASYYQSKVNAIKTMAEKHGWQGYLPNSQDISINPSAYNSDMIEVSVSISFQIDGNSQALNQLTQIEGVYSISSSSYNDQSCSGY